MSICVAGGIELVIGPIQERTFSDGRSIRRLQQHETGSTLSWDAI